MITGYDMLTGRPLHGDEEAVETLADEELEAELTIAVLDPERRERRYERLLGERSHRRRATGSPKRTHAP